MLKQSRGFLIFSSLILLAIFTIENINHRFWLNDFKVYYEAAKALLNDRNVYDELFALGSGFFKYSPFTLLLFTPFTLLPYEIAAVIQYFILAIAITGSFLIIRKIVEEYYLGTEVRKANLWMSLGFLACVNHFVRELHLGNINVLLLLALSATVLLIIRQKAIPAGFLLALIVITKPFFGILLMPLLFRRQFKVLIIFSLSIFWFIASPALITGVSANIELHRQWISTMLSHNSGFPSNNTIQAIIGRYIGNTPDLLILGSMIGLITMLIIYHLRNENASGQKTKNLIMEWFLIIALMPNLFKTDTQHFLLSLPMILITIAILMQMKAPIASILLTLVLLAYGGNSTDLLGKKLSGLVDQWGLLGISNIILIGLLLYLSKVEHEKNQVNL